MKSRTKAKHNKAKSSKRPLQIDPSRTGQLRRQFMSLIKSKFSTLKARILRLVETEDVFGLNTPVGNRFQGITGNTKWKFKTSPEKLKAFKEWLRAELKGQLTSKSDEELWKKYVQEGYRKGAGRAFDDTRKPYVKGYAKDESTSDFYRGTKEEFLRSSFTRPVAVERVQMIAGRSFDDLENITSDMSTRITRCLAGGLTRGLGARELARDLADEVDLGMRRAMTVARTEIIRAHAEGQLDSLSNLGVEEVGVAVEWSTAGDDKVCPLCEPLEGIVLKIDEARDMLPRHPNCRCAWIPANVGEDDDGQKKSKADIDGALRESGLEDDVDIGRDRPRAILNQYTPHKSDYPTEEELDNWIIGNYFLTPR